MESYLMMLYVTLEQETALKDFFLDHGWNFNKPDLTVLTDQLGPPIQITKTMVSTTDVDSNPVRKYKRKAEVRQEPRDIKIDNTIPLKEVSAKCKQKLTDLNSQISKADWIITEDKHAYQDAEYVDMSVSSVSEQSAHGDSVKTVESRSVPGNDFDINLNGEYNDFDDGPGVADDEIGDSNDMEDNNKTYDENKQKFDDSVYGEMSTAASDHKKSQIMEGTEVVSKDINHESLKCATCKHFEEQAAILDNGPSKLLTNREASGVFICEVCGKQFYNQKSYKRHLNFHEYPERTKIIPERKQKCMHCDKTFLSDAHLKEHIDQVHLGKPGNFMCHLCPKSFTRAGRLQAHLNTHFGIKPYKCRSCSTSFYGRSSLIQHEKKCEGGITVRFNCQFCVEYFTSARELKEHRMQKHANNFVLAPCGQKIRWKYSLKKHIATCLKCKDIEIKNMS